MQREEGWNILEKSCWGIGEMGGIRGGGSRPLDRVVVRRNTNLAT